MKNPVGIPRNWVCLGVHNEFNLHYLIHAAPILITPVLGRYGDKWCWVHKDNLEAAQEAIKTAKSRTFTSTQYPEKSLLDIEQEALSQETQVSA